MHFLSFATFKFLSVALHGTFNRADIATSQRWHLFYMLDGSNSNKPLFGKWQPDLYASYVVSGLPVAGLSQEYTLPYPEVGRNEEQNTLLLYLSKIFRCLYFTFTSYIFKEVSMLSTFYIFTTGSLLLV